MRLSVTKTAKTCPIEIAANMLLVYRQPQLPCRRCFPNYSSDLPARFALAHLAFIASDLAFLTAAESSFLAFLGAGSTSGAGFLIPAHLAC